MRLTQLNHHMLDVFRRLVRMSVCGPTVLQESGHPRFRDIDEANHSQFPSQSHTAHRVRSWGPLT
jgi:hypothetical protein